MSSYATRGATSSARQRRLSELADVIYAEGPIRVDELAERFELSAMTIYRDIAELEQAGVVQLDRGQVSAATSSLNESSTEFRLSHNTTAKAALCAAAAAHLRRGMTVMLDDSTTTLRLVDAMTGLTPITVVTNSHMVLRAVSRIAGLDLVVAGGRYRAVTESFYGSTTVAALRGLSADVCVISAAAIDGGVCYHPYEECVDVKRAMLASARKRVLLADSSKFGRRALYVACPVDDFDVVIVDDRVPPAVLADLAERDAELVVVPMAPPTPSV